MGKIRCLDRIKRLEDIYDLQRDEFILIRGKIEKIVSLKRNKFLTTLKTVKTEHGEMNLGRNYIITSQYKFYKEKDLPIIEPSKITLEKVKEKDYNDLEKTLTNSFYSHSF
jgi:hypothetical protein